MFNSKSRRVISSSSKASRGFTNDFQTGENHFLEHFQFCSQFHILKDVKLRVNLTFKIPTELWNEIDEHKNKSMKLLLRHSIHSGYGYHLYGQ